MAKNEQKPEDKKVTITITTKAAEFLKDVLIRLPIAMADPRFQSLMESMKAVTDALPPPDKKELTRNNDKTQ